MIVSLILMNNEHFLVFRRYGFVKDASMHEKFIMNILPLRAHQRMNRVFSSYWGLLFGLPIFFSGNLYENEAIHYYIDASF